MQPTREYNNFFFFAVRRKYYTQYITVVLINTALHSQNTIQRPKANSRKENQTCGCIIYIQPCKKVSTKRNGYNLWWIETQNISISTLCYTLYYSYVSARCTTHFTADSTVYYSVPWCGVVFTERPDEAKAVSALDTASFISYAVRYRYPIPHDAKAVNAKIISKWYFNSGEKKKLIEYKKKVLLWEGTLLRALLPRDVQFCNTIAWSYYPWFE